MTVIRSARRDGPLVETVLGAIHAFAHGIAAQAPYIMGNSFLRRERTMSFLRRTTISATALLALTGLAGACLSASAQVLDSPTGNALIRQNDLQILQNRVQRQQYQQQQQQYRAQDRQVVQPARPEVPTLKPSCRAQIIGTTAVTNCR